MKEEEKRKMEKHLIIAGISRGGKTSICKEIVKKLDYQYIGMDRIVRAFQNHFPKTGIVHNNRFFNVSPHLAPFLNSMLEDNIEDKVLIDTYHLVPEDYAKYINQEICNVCFIGFPDISVEQKFQEMRKYEQRQEDIEKTDDELKQKCKRLIEESQFLKAECEKWNVPFLNTSYEREKVIAEFVNSL